MPPAVQELQRFGKNGRVPVSTSIDKSTLTVWNGRCTPSLVNNFSYHRLELSPGSSDSLNQPSRDWRELAEAARKETDPQRLMELVEELNRALDRKENTNQQTRQSSVRKSFCLV